MCLQRIVYFEENIYDLCRKLCNFIASSFISRGSGSFCPHFGGGSTSANRKRAAIPTLSKELFRDSSRNVPVYYYARSIPWIVQQALYHSAPPETLYLSSRNMSVVNSSLPTRAALPLRLLSTSRPCQRSRITRKAQTRRHYKSTPNPLENALPRPSLWASNRTVGRCKRVRRIYKQPWDYLRSMADYACYRDSMPQVPHMPRKIHITS